MFSDVSHLASGFGSHLPERKGGICDNNPAKPHHLLLLVDSGGPALLATLDNRPNCISAPHSPFPRGWRTDRQQCLREPIRHHGTVAETTSQADNGEPQNLYDAIGGEPTFRAIVARFYAEVAGDEVLRPIYPDDDLGPAEEKLRLFLMQYWGGPRTYSEQRGHPRLRMRHAPFKIGPTERDAWLRAMRVAVDEAALPEPYHQRLWSYLEMAAHSMLNSWE